MNKLAVEKYDLVPSVKKNGAVLDFGKSTFEKLLRNTKWQGGIKMVLINQDVLHDVEK